MRIDDENKVVWCNDVILAWYKSYGIAGNRKERIIYHLSRVGFGYGLTNVNNMELPLDEWCDIDKNRVIQAILNDYAFKLEQHKKYHWRKKREYISILDTRIFLGAGVDGKGALSKGKSQKFTEQEAREILKDDFDKFEKVECEE